MFTFCLFYGPVAHLVRARAWHARGEGFDPPRVQKLLKYTTPLRYPPGYLLVRCINKVDFA